jgi:hypothetical protein
MRGISLLVAGTVLTSCAMEAPLPSRTANAEQQYQQLLAGKVAGAPVSCLPRYSSSEMTVVDPHTIVFKFGSSRVYVAHMESDCDGLSANGPYALLTHQFAGTGLCRGDIAQVVDPLNRVTVGSCVWGDFVPYTNAGGYRG